MAGARYNMILIPEALLEMMFGIMEHLIQRLRDIPPFDDPALGDGTRMARAAEVSEVIARDLRFMNEQLYLYLTPATATRLASEWSLPEEQGLVRQP